MNCRKHGIEVTGCSKNPNFPLIKDCSQCDPIQTSSWKNVMEYESVPHWQERLAVSIGMTTQETIEQFLAWQENKKTCERCGGGEYLAYCPVRLTCKEASEHERRRPATESVDNRAGYGKVFRGIKAISLSVPKRGVPVV